MTKKRCRPTDTSIAASASRAKLVRSGLDPHWKRAGRPSLIALCSTLTAVGTPDAVAQDLDEGLPEIVVTAQRRAENLQAVPLAITALSSDSLRERGVNDIYGLRSLTPNFDAHQNNGEVKVFIRGIGKTLDNPGAEGSVAVHQDGVVISVPSGQSTAFYDIDRIEVLRGPQGTLYGRNATGGAVNIITRGPTEDVKINARVSVGNYGATEAEVGVGGALLPGKLLGRLAVMKIGRGGFGRNIFNGEEVDDRDEFGVRGKLRLLATEQFTAELQFDYWRADDAAGIVHTFGSAFGTLQGVLDGGTAAPNIRDIASENEQGRNVKTYGASLELAYEIGDAWTLKSLSGYRDIDRVQVGDFDGTTTPGWKFNNVNDGHQFSQELQVSYDTDRLHGILGLYYFESSIFSTNTVPFGFNSNLPGDIFDQRGTAKTKAYAAFGSLTWAATDKLNLTAGLRYSDEKRRSAGSFEIRVQPFVDAFIPLAARRSWNALTPRFSVDYTFAEGAMVYATVSRGFKSGQILPGNTNPPIDPEFVWSYELGLKTTLLDNRMRANLTGFYYDYTDLQVSQLDGLNFTIKNAAKAEIKGFEAEIAFAPTSRTSLELTYGFLDATFSEFLTADPIFPALGTLDLSGNPLPSAPKHMITAGAAHAFPTSLGEFEIRADWRWRDKAYFDPYRRSSASQGAYSETNVRATFRPENYPQWSVALWANNLFDKEAITTNYISLASGGFPRNGGANDPRTYGIEFRYNY
jgi:iron complex outermembrane receptor protein